MSLLELPHQPRLLTPDELSAHDVHLFRSPKLRNRGVQIIGVPCFALALLYEFNPDVLVWMERPRFIPLEEDHFLEVSFWLRYRDGTEEYVLVVPAYDTEAAAKGARRYRLAKQLMDVAQRLALRLVFVFEAEIAARAAEVSTAFRLLPYVQTARALANRPVLRDAVCQVIASSPGLRLSQLQAALDAFHPSDVQAIAADLIHDGSVAIDPLATLSLHTVLTLGGVV